MPNSKIIPRSYGYIQHLSGSKMIDAADKLIAPREESFLTVRTNTIKDIVIVTEKVDGCNVGVLRQGDDLIPILRSGYDVRSNPLAWIQRFAGFVHDRADRFMALLEDGERVCGEWMIKTHTLRYRMKHEPFIVFDIIAGNERRRYTDIARMAAQCGFVSAGLVHMGMAIPVETALKMLGDGFHGAQDGVEGVVYRYESPLGWQFNAKYVSNPLVGDQELFKRNTEDERAFNKYK